MRVASIILTVAGAALSCLMIFLLLFWFAFPQWWPDLVIRFSPSLRHVLFADSCRYNDQMSSSHVRFSLSPEPGDYARFEAQLGDHIYASMAACDDGVNGPIRPAILRYLSDHLHQPKARKVVWDFSDGGDSNARAIIYRHTERLPQGIDATQVHRAASRDGQQPPSR